MKNTDKNEILDAINDLKNNFNGLENNFNGLENKFNGLENNFNGLENKFNGLENNFNGLENKFNGLSNRFDNLEKKFGNFEEDLASVKQSCLRMEVEHGEILAILKDAVAANLDKHKVYDDFSEKTEKKLFNHDIRLGIIEDSNFYKREYKNKEFKEFKESPLL